MSASRPKIGKNAAIASRYATATQLTVLSFAPNSRSSRGSSIWVMLESTQAMTAATQMVPTTNQR